MKLPPGPKTATWLQNLQFEADPFGYMDAISKRYGDIVTIMSGSTPTVHISNPLGIKQIFTNTTEITVSGALNGGFALMTGKQGILQLDGLRHKHRRKLLMPGFHGARMQAYGATYLRTHRQNSESTGDRQTFCCLPNHRRYYPTGGYRGCDGIA
jgi:cytochrome P450